MDQDTVQDWESAPVAAEKNEVSTDDAGESGAPATVTAEQPAAAEGEKADKPEAPAFDIEAERKRIADERRALNRDSYEVRQLKKKLKEKEAAKPDEIELTDAQFEQLIETHQSDPKMQVQIMKQMAKQIAKGSEVKATDAVEIKQMKTEMDGYLSTNFPDLAKEDSELRGSLEKARSILRVEDHPFADFLSMAGIMFKRLPELVKAAEERGRADAMKGAVESRRKETIKGNKPASGGTPPDKKGEPSEGNNYGLTAEQMETAKKNFGFSRPQQFKWYAANLRTAQGQSGARA